MSTADKHAKTEPATPKRKREAREKGQVARSPDFAGWAAILAASVAVPALFSSVYRRMLVVTNEAAHVMAHPTVAGAVGVLGSGLFSFVIAFLPIGLVLMAVGVATNIAQVGLSFSFKAARPQLSRASPKAGFKRLFSPNTVWELGKQMLKLAALTGIGYSALYGLGRAVTGARPASPIPVVSFAGSSILGMVRAVSLAGLALGFADFLVQRQRMAKGLRMTKQEVKDEHRQQEGDPVMKGELRKRQYTIARSRMMASVKTADVVVTNPTHYAVALQYTPSVGRAPKVVAKGADGLARRIREEAASHEVPIVEDPPLARYLYATVEVEQAIPGEIYLVVARLLAFVYALPASVRGVGVHHRGASAVPSRPDAIEGMRSGRRAAARRVLGVDAA